MQLPYDHDQDNLSTHDINQKDHTIQQVQDGATDRYMIKAVWNGGINTEPLKYTWSFVCPSDNHIQKVKAEN